MLKCHMHRHDISVVCHNVSQTQRRLLLSQQGNVQVCGVIALNSRLIIRDCHRPHIEWSKVCKLTIFVHLLKTTIIFLRQGLMIELQ